MLSASDAKNNGLVVWFYYACAQKIMVWATPVPKAQTAKTIIPQIFSIVKKITLSFCFLIKCITWHGRKMH